MRYTFTEYRSRASKTLWSKYSLDRVCRDHRFRTSRFDNICADHWKNDAEIFECAKALESYLISENIAFRLAGK
jgi:hypothetical protein